TIERGRIAGGLAGRVAPLELVGRHVGNGRRIELGGAASCYKANRDKACRGQARRYRSPRPRTRCTVTIGHFFLPCVPNSCCNAAPSQALSLYFLVRLFELKFLP